MSITSPAMAWAIVILSGVLEIVFSVTMKFSEGFTRPLYSTVSIASAVSSVWLMSITLRHIPIGTAYAVWAGIGAAGTALIGMVWLGEAVTLMRVLSISAVVVGVVGLQLQG